MGRKNKWTKYHYSLPCVWAFLWAFFAFISSMILFRFWIVVWTPWLYIWRWISSSFLNVFARIIEISIYRTAFSFEAGGCAGCEFWLLIYCFGALDPIEVVESALWFDICMALGSIWPVLPDLYCAYNFWITSAVLKPIFNNCLANFNFYFFDWLAWNFNCSSELSPSAAVCLAKWGGTYPGGNGELFPVKEGAWWILSFEEVYVWAWGELLLKFRGFFNCGKRVSNYSMDFCKFSNLFL